MSDWLEDTENGLTDRFRGLLSGLWEDTQQLQQLRGVSPLVATALVATVSDGGHFSKGR